MLINETYTAPLSNEIKKEFNKLILLLSGIDPNLLYIKGVEGTTGKVSIVDLTAYQLGWGTLLINWYESGLQGKMPQMPGEGFSTWDYVGLAHYFYKKYHFDDYERQWQEFHKVVKQILAITDYEYQTKNLDKEGVWDWCTLASGKQWPLRKWIRVNTVAPYKRSINLIRKFVKGSV